MYPWSMCPRLAVALFAWHIASAQTTLDVRTQSRNVDFSNAVSTKPSKTGTIQPASCSVGETFFKTDAAVGRNLYFCTSPNTWSQMSGAGAGQSGAAASLGVNGGGTKAQTTDGGFPANAIPAIEGTGKSVDSGCTATSGSANCPDGFASGTGPSRITITGGSTRPAPAAGQQTFYLDSADHRIKLIDSSSLVQSLLTTAGGKPAPGAMAAYDAAGNLLASSCTLTAGRVVCGLGAGSSLTIPAWFEFPAAVCQGDLAYLVFNTFSVDVPAAVCVAGTNTTFGVAAFTSTAQGGQLRFILPDDWAAGAGNDIEFHFRSETAGGNGNIVWSAQTACSPNPGGAADPAFHAAQTAAAAAQPNSLLNRAILNGFSTGGCSPGNVLLIRFALHGTTTATGAQDLLSLRIKLKRATTTSAAQNPNTYVNSPRVGGCPVFPDKNVWNARIDSLPVDPSSAGIVNSYAAVKLGTVPDFAINLADATTPAFPVSFDSPESDGGNYPITPNMQVEGYAFGASFPVSGGPYPGDAHLLMVRTDQCKLYEIYSMGSAAPPYTAGSGAIFDLTTNDLRPDGWTSADAAGLPIWPGILTYAELYGNGEIQHMVRFTVDRTRNSYVWPARHYASHSSDPSLPPMGSRWRLKASFDGATCHENEHSGETFPPEVQRLIRALKGYGMILADNGLAIKISTDADSRWGDPDSPDSPNWSINGWAHCITGQDFEVINPASLMADPNSGVVK